MLTNIMPSSFAGSGVAGSSGSSGSCGSKAPGSGSGPGASGGCSLQPAKVNRIAKIVLKTTKLSTILRLMFMHGRLGFGSIGAFSSDY
jgi:hypothetical protein